MPKPTLNTMDVSKIGRETDQNIRRIHSYQDALEGHLQRLQAQVDALPPIPSTADIHAIVTASTASIGLTPGLSGPPPTPAPTSTPGGGPLPDHLDVVTAAHDAVIAAGISITGDCGAFEITKRVAWALVPDEAGLLDKPGGANCDGYAVAIICYPTGQIFDILFDAGTTNTPQWNDAGLVDPTRWRPAIDPGPPYV